MSNPQYLVVIPALNESKQLGKVITQIRAAGHWPVLVVDDGSTDGTAEIARQEGAQVVRHPFNLGYGAALQTGYRYALGHDYAGVVQVDADGQHEPSCIERLTQRLDEHAADVVIGSRFMDEASYQPPLARRIGMRFFRAAVSFTTGSRLTDPTSGFKALGRDSLKYLSGDRLPSDYPDADVLIMLRRAGFTIAEVPARMYSADASESMHQGLRPIYYVFKMLLSIFVTLLRSRDRS